MYLVRAAKTAVFFLVLISSNAFLALWKDGGARPEGVANYEEYSGPLIYVPYLWALGALALSAVLLLGKGRVLKVFKSVHGIAPFLLHLFVLVFLADDPFESLKVFVLFFSGVILILSVSNSLGVSVILRGVELAFVFVVLMSFCSAILLPGYGLAQGVHEGLWQGVFAHKNNLGNFCVLSLAYFLMLWKCFRRTHHIIFSVLSLALIFLSGSTTSLMTALVVFALYVVFLALPKSFSLKRFPRLFRLTVVAMVSISILFVLSSLYFPDIQFMEKDGSYSGRDKIWVYFLLKFIDHPFLGHGLGQITLSNDAVVDSLFEGIGFAVSSTHNGYIDLLFVSGLLGFFLFGRILYFIASGLTNRTSFYVVWVGVLPVLFLNSFESRLISFGFYFYFILMCSLWARSMKPEENKR